MVVKNRFFSLISSHSYTELLLLLLMHALKSLARQQPKVSLRERKEGGCTQKIMIFSTAGRFHARI
jgi:hypothetical protein